MLLFATVATDLPKKKEMVSLDEALFGRISQGDQNAFHELYEASSNAVFTFALSLLKDRHDAEDVMQDTFLKIHCAAHLYQPMGKPMAWILTIARNLCMMKLREKKKHTDATDDEIAQIPDLGKVEDHDDRIVLETAFSCLSEEEMEIVMLHSVSGMKHREISDALGIPLSTVLSKYNRSLKKMRKELEGKL